MSSSVVALKQTSEPRPRKRARFDLALVTGIAISLAAVMAGIAAAGLRLSYFVQPSSLWIVFGGTFGVTLITTPRHAVANAARRVCQLFWHRPAGRPELIEEILGYLRKARTGGMLALEPLIEDASHPLLKEALSLALEVPRMELEAALSTKIRMAERRGESEAKTLEVAGGFAPTIGILGTVVGLVDALRQFSDVTSVALGVGAAFASTLYGLGLANLVLLPLAHRIRATVADNFETEELILEGTLCIFDGVHPSLAPDRLKAFLRAGEQA